ncbi:hypothetical protein L3X38_023819 [Prunus dulcis]|uniref:Uncharacterized protein n=1 Tax=Prunus dulcis TaxID=3755 RepID=A0AAD4W0J0_PRUDU|nr:hypothetical protein L3X38_023819 [Prunus dulcis]
MQANNSNLTLGKYIRAILIVYREVKLFTNQDFCNKEGRKARWPGGGFPVHATAWGHKTFENVSLGDTKSIRAANWQDSGDRSQPDMQSWQTLTTPSQTELQIMADLGDTKSNRATNPGTHGPGVPETRETNVKCTDKTESKLDVCRHRHN